ncbi:unnamed protein product, partial [Allacma fusca]
LPRVCVSFNRGCDEIRLRNETTEENS